MARNDADKGNAKGEFFEWARSMQVDLQKQCDIATKVLGIAQGKVGATPLVTKPVVSGVEKGLEIFQALVGKLASTTAIHSMSSVGVFETKEFDSLKKEAEGRKQTGTPSLNSLKLFVCR